jgi:hypothetical protein
MKRSEKWPRWAAGPSGSLCSAGGGSVPRTFPIWGRGVAAESRVAMRTIVPLDRTMQLPLNLAGGLRTTFANVGSSPLPERLAALVRRLGADCTES